MYPETNTLPKQPYPAVPIGTSSAAGLVDYIITRNTKDFTSGNIPAVTPEQFIEIITGIE
jgi:hypothetical protein